MKSGYNGIPQTVLPLLTAAAAAPRPVDREKKEALYELSHPAKLNKNALRFEKTGTFHITRQNKFVAQQGIPIHEFIDFVKDLTLPKDGLRHCEMDFAIPQDSHLKNNFVEKKENPDDFELILVGREVGTPWLKAVLRRGDDIILRSSSLDTNYNGCGRQQRPPSQNDGTLVIKTMFLADITFWAKLKQCI